MGNITEAYRVLKESGSEN
jgi:hypothetical protein